MSLETEIHKILETLNSLIEENIDISDEKYIQSLKKMQKYGRLAIMQLEEYGKRN